MYKELHFEQIVTLQKFLVKGKRVDLDLFMNTLSGEKYKVGCDVLKWL
jgi:hypothetical protein